MRLNFASAKPIIVGLGPRFSSKNSRTRAVATNAIGSLALKGGSVLATLILVPITLNYLRPSEYGIWFTITSIMTWINIFDVGLGHGLRNTLSKFVASSEYENARKVLGSTARAILFIAIGVGIVGLALVPMLSWRTILNVSDISEDRLTMIVGISCLSTLFVFVLRIVGVVYLALQKSWVNDLIAVVGNILALAGVYLLVRYDSSRSFLRVASVYSITQPVVYLAFGAWLFLRGEPRLCPRWSDFRERCDAGVVKQGVRFFALQILGLLMFATASVFIAHIGVPQDVASYNIAGRLFSPLGQFFQILITPMWSAFTAAKQANDLEWIRTTIRRLWKVWLAFQPAYILLVILSQWLYELWVGDAVDIPIALTIGVGIFFSTNSLLGISASYLNGVGCLRLQMYSLLFITFIHMPLSLFLSKYAGYIAVPASIAILNTLHSIIMSIQVSRLINGTAKGWWAR